MNARGRSMMTSDQMPPCSPTCPDRKADPNCHASCPLYAEYKALMSRIRDKERRENAKCGYGLRGGPRRAKR